MKTTFRYHCLSLSLSLAHYNKKYTYTPVSLTAIVQKAADGVHLGASLEVHVTAPLNNWVRGRFF